MKYLIGQIGRTKRGQFKVLRETPSNYVAHYIEGEWKGKYVLVPKEPAYKGRVESLRMPKHEAERFLDNFYKMFKQEYNQTWLSIRTQTGDMPESMEMFERLREEWTPLFQMVMQEHFRRPT